MINATTLSQDGTGALACIRRGNFSSITANQAGRITRTNTALLRWYADDAGVVLTGSGSVPDIRNAIYRTLLTKDNTGGDIRVHGLMGQIKAYDAKWNDEVVSAVHGRIELVRSASTMTLGGNGITAAVLGVPSVSGAVTVNTNHFLAGVAAVSDFRATLTQTGTVAAFLAAAYDTTNWSDGTARTTWGYGLYIAASAAATGIYIGSGTTAISFGASAGKVVDAASSVSIYGGGTTGDALVLQGSSADAGQKITITGATGTTILGNLILGASGSETVVFTAKLGSQLYSNLTGTAYTVLKIHNHDTTAEIGGLESKGDLINTTGSVVGEQASWTYEPTGATGTPTGVSASSNVLAVSPGFTVTTGNIYALVGEAQLYGTLNGAAVNVAGVIGVVGGNGANTQVLHMAGVQSAMSTGLVNPTTGTLSYFLANSLSTVVIDNLICSLQSQYITNFVSFDAVGGCVVANTHQIDSHALQHIIVVKVGSDTGYIPVYDSVPA